VYLERPAQDLVRDLPDKIRFFSEVIGHEESPVMMWMREAQNLPKGLVFVQFQMYNDFMTIVGHHSE
jgi:hypothetical protein